MIYERLRGVLSQGTVLLRCHDCNEGPNDEAYTALGFDTPQVLLVCMNGHPLGQWDTLEQRDAELAQFRENVLQHHVPVKKMRPAKRNSKNESKSKSMGYGGGRKRIRKDLRKKGRKS